MPSGFPDQIVSMSVQDSPNRSGSSKNPQNAFLHSINLNDVENLHQSHQDL